MFTKILKSLLLLLLIVLSYKIYGGENFYLLQNANLTFHEAGHTLLMFFGNFLHVLGGSFGQIFFPVIFAFYFITRQDYFSFSVMIWWLGENITEIGIYMADARIQILPLLGGDKSGHDWTFLFTKTGLLSYDVVIGNFTWWIGIIVMILSMAYGGYSILKK
jgi:hypothetical protein